MLILTRNIGKSILIGEEIEVKVLGVDGMQVKLGIEAPKDVAVHRAEVAERIQREKQGKAA